MPRKMADDTIILGMPILVVTEGQTSRLEIGPRATTPGTRLFIQFTPWDAIPVGEPGAGKPLSCILLTREWYEEYIEGKVVHEWLDSYDKLIDYFEKSPHYQFGCGVCGARLETVEGYRKHLDEHRATLKQL